MTDPDVAEGVLRRRLERERQARLAAEQLAERTTRKLYDSVGELSLFKEVMDATPDYVAILDRDGAIGYLNDAARRLIGWTLARDVAGCTLDDMLPVWSIHTLRTEAMPEAGQRGVWSGELTLRRADGNEVPVSLALVASRDASGRPESYCALCRDLSERKAYEAELSEQAFFDSLTGLPNRFLFVERLRQALDQVEKSRAMIAVLVVGVDRFSRIVESLGHEAADRLLVAVADRLHGALNQGDSLARLGTDTFAVLCQADLPTDPESTAARLIEGLARPFLMQARQYTVTPSIGLTTVRGRRERPEALIRNADTAMHQARRHGGGRLESFDSNMRVRAVERLEMENGLRGALARHEFEVHFQPEVDLRTGVVAGFEALVRWNDPRRGMVPPSMFIPVAEDTGLIVPLGERVFQESCRQLRRWHEADPDAPPTFVAVNLSLRQMAQRQELVDSILRTLVETQVDPASVYLEITESVLAERPESAVDLLHRLKALGVQLALDDFGTGYSSLSYMRHFPADLIKIDRSFIARLGSDSRDAAIVKAIITMAHEMGLRVVAEGVETTEQAALLREYDCDLAQGFLFGRAGPAGDPAARVPVGRVLPVTPI